MKINKEKLKSFILISLVLVSIFLTWTIWTYQPTYETIEEGSIVEYVTVGSKKELDDLIQPTELMYLMFDSQIIGTKNTDELQNIISELQKWDFSDIVNISYTVEDVHTILNTSSSVVLKFDTIIPMDIYKNTLDEKNESLPSFDFNYAVIDYSTMDSEIGLVYFIDEVSETVYASSVQASLFNSLKSKYLLTAINNTNYERLGYEEVDGNRRIYYPRGKSIVTGYQHLFMPIDTDKFKNALFKNPDLVQKYSMISGTEYTDGYSLLRAFDNYTLSYVNPSETIIGLTDSIDSVKRSIDYINGHAGWNQSYRVTLNDTVNHIVEFSMYHDTGFPIFSDISGLSTIHLRWGNNGIVEYFRGNFSLGVEMSTFEKELVAGELVLDYLQKFEDISLADVEDITIGYKLVRDGNSRVVNLEPNWYFRSFGKWKQVKFEPQERS